MRIFIRGNTPSHSRNIKIIISKPFTLYVFKGYLVDEKYWKKICLFRYYEVLLSSNRRTTQAHKYNKWSDLNLYTWLFPKNIKPFKPNYSPKRYFAKRFRIYQYFIYETITNHLWSEGKLSFVKIFTFPGNHT